MSIEGTVAAPPEFAEPTRLTLNANYTLPDGTRLVVLVNADDPTRLLTVPRYMTALVVNESTLTPFDIQPYGRDIRTVQASSWFLCCWNSALDRHEYVVVNLGTVDQAMSGTSLRAIGNAAAKAYIDSAVAAVSAGAVVFATLGAMRATATLPAVVWVSGHTAAMDGGEGCFDRLVSSGGTVGDIGSGGHDDDGWHVVCTSTGAVYGRRAEKAIPEHFKSQRVATEALAEAGTDQSARMQRWADFFCRPQLFPGLLYRPKQGTPDAYAPDGLYRCNSTIEFKIVENPSNPYQTGVAPARLFMAGRIFTPKAINVPGAKVYGGLNPAKPAMRILCVKGRETTGRVMWNAVDWPDLYRDDAAYRAWAASTVFYAGEYVKQVISGATHLYEVTVGGTAGVSAPSHTSGSAANGGLTLAYLGRTRTTAGKSTRDLLKRCEDVGVWVDHCRDWVGLEIGTWHYTVAVRFMPASGPGHANGFNRFCMLPQYGCKFGYLFVFYLYDELVADATARLALTGMRVGSRVRQSNDATNDYLFNGPAGGESSAGNWSTTTRATSGAWCNENKVEGGLIYAYGSGGWIDNNKSVYGAVLMNLNAAEGGPTGVSVDAMSVEFQSIVAPAEAVQYVLDECAENELWARNDTPSQTAAVVCIEKIDRALEARQNRIRVCRGGRRSNLPSWRKDRSNGMLNIVEETPGSHQWIKEFMVESLWSDAVFSGKDKVYFQKSSISKYNPATIQDFGAISTTGGAGIVANAVTKAFTLAQDTALTVIVNLPDNATGDAYLEVEPFLAGSTGGMRVEIGIYDPITGALAKFDPVVSPAAGQRARNPIRSIGGEMFWDGGPYVWCRNGAEVREPGVYSVERWVRKLALRIWGTNLTGYAVRLFNAPGGSVVSAFDAVPRGLPYLEAAPERGIWQSPAEFRFVNQTGANKGCRLNKTAASGVWWAVSQTGGLPGSPTLWQWASDAAGTVKEWNGSTWSIIATGVQLAVPADWVAFS